MSDKKQPAQQRVSVRIVKADDPEQRSGMKPIAKADGSLQISPEEAYTAGIWTKPPFDLRGLSKMVTKAPYSRSASGPTSPTSPDSELTSGTKTTLQTRTKPRR